ncbi:MAG: O-antigen ligase family protein, partial [Chitinophagales bacterium]
MRNIDSSNEKYMRFPFWIKAVCFLFFPLLSLSCFPFLSEIWLLSRFAALTLFTGLLSIWCLYFAPATIKAAFQNTIIHPLSLIFLLLFAFHFAQSFRSSDWLSNLGDAFKIMQWALLFMLIYVLGKYEELRILILKSVIAAILLVLIAASIQMGLMLYARGSIAIGYDELYHVDSLFGHKNIFSISLFTGIPLLILAIYNLKGFWKLLSSTLLILSLLFILFLQTRSVLLAIAFGSFMAFIAAVFKKNTRFWLWCFIKNNVLRLKFIVPAILIITAFLIWNTQFQSWENNFFKRISGLVEWDESLSHYNHTIKERVYLYSNTWELIREKPLVGYGAGNWKFIFPSKGLTGFKTEQGDVHFTRPHNDFLWVWMELGLAAFLCFALLFIWIFYQSVKFLYQQKNTGYHLLILALSVGFLLISIFDFPKERIFPYTLFTTNLALYFRTFKPSNSAVKLQWLNPLVKVLLPLFVFANLLVIFILTLGHFHTKKVLKSWQLNQYEKVIEHGLKAKQWKVPVDYFAWPVDYYIGEAQFHQGDINSAQSSFLKAEKIHPYHLLNLNNIASSYYLQGDVNSALKYYNKALSLSYNFDEALVNLMFHYMNQKDIDRALSCMVRIPPNTSHPKFKQGRTNLVNVFLKNYPKSIEQASVRNYLFAKVGDSSWIEQMHQYAF